MHDLMKLETTKHKIYVLIRRFFGLFQHILFPAHLYCKSRYHHAENERNTIHIHMKFISVKICISNRK